MSQLAAGTRIGPYEIATQIGAGGMGEVYRATDTRLKRQVALKVLPAAVTADPDRLARFQREAEVLASLNHPNIAALYGIEESDGVKALVMELVEGPTLADRIEQGPIPIAEALPIASLIAQALAAAHEQGIIHRDLKPANIKLRTDGEVKVLDFGLAKAVDPVTTAGRVSISPTITSPAQMTAAGLILGTAAYMSPEQAAGRVVDRRTDLWAFGVVLFEMLSGRRLFDGESVSHVIAAVLKDEPDWAALPADLPESIARLLKRCLDKDRRKRLSDAATAAFECGETLTSPNHAGVTHATPVARSWMSPWQIAASVMIGAIVTAMIGWTRWPLPAPAPQSSRFALELPSDHLLTRAGRHVVALSPDGMTLAYIANRQIFLHSFRDLTTAVISGTAGVDPSEPVFSPDGTWIAYWSDGSLKKIPVSGGTAARLADIGNPLGLSWSDDRIIVGQSRSIVEVPANGGSPKTLVSIDQTADDWVQSPQLIDDGRAVLFTLRTEGDWNNADIVVQDLASGQRTALVHGATDGHLLPRGVLVYARENALFGVRVDEKTRATSGDTIPLEHNVLPSVGGFSGASQMAWSRAGTMAYVVDSTAAETSLSWLTRDGKTEQTALPPRNYYPASRSIQLSRDGTRVAARIVGASRSQSDVWVGDIARGTFTRLSATGKATDPVWTADGARVCFRENPTGVLCRVPDGSAPSELVFQLDHLSTLLGFTSDHEHVLLAMNSANGLSDISMVANRPPFKEERLLSTPANEVMGAVSPDGHWIAYQSNESGQDEIFVSRFPNVAGARWQVSATGGSAPRWSRDSRELYYLALETGGTALRSTLTMVPVQPGATFTTGAATMIAKLPSSVAAYDVAPDGRFLVNIAAATPTGLGGTRQSLVVVQNWLGELESRVFETKH